MERKYVAFDIETAKVIPGRVHDLKAHRPLGIACAAALPLGHEHPRVWHGQSPNEDRPARQMEPDEVANLVKDLEEFVGNGFTILTWNGASFDFDILAEESGLKEACVRLAESHVDMMFHAFCKLGFRIGLDAAARAMGLTGKSSDVSAEIAPQLWADGKTAEVIEYVTRDVTNTLQLAAACEKRRSLSWITQKGKTRDMPLTTGWLTVNEALRLPEPDTSWMDAPVRRSEFIGWFR